MQYRNYVIGLCATAAMQACSGDGDIADQPPPVIQPSPTATLEVTVTNLTNAQPLSPVAVIAHDDAYAVFVVGDPASAGLEELAEAGDNNALLDEANADAGVLETASGVDVIGPAASETVSLEILESELDGLRISVSTMLVNTNDAISGVNGVNVSDMDVGDAITMRAIAYDAGTEANNEFGSDIPGPAAGGEGFNPARDDREDRVSMHAGVVTQDDGYAGSVLTNQHRFDNPVSQVRIERTD